MLEEDSPDSKSLDSRTLDGKSLDSRSLDSKSLDTKSQNGAISKEVGLILVTSFSVKLFGRMQSVCVGKCEVYWKIVCSFSRIVSIHRVTPYEL